MTHTLTTRPDESPDRLRRDAVSLPGVIAHSLSVIAPTMSGAFITYLAAQKAGGATPLAFLLATVACILIGLVVCDFAARLPSAGSVYTYTVHGLGPACGFVVGCCYAVAYAVGCPAVLAGFGVFTATVAQNRGAPAPLGEWWFWFGVGLVIYWATSWFGIRFSTRAQLVLTAVTSATIGLLALIVIGKGGAHGNTVSAFDPGTAGVGWGLVLGGMAFGLLSFAGFETAASLAEETRDPRRNIPRAVLGTVLVAGAFYLLVTYATSIGYGVREATTAWPASGGGLAALAAEYAPWLTDWVLLAGGLCALFAGVGVHNTVARTLYAMGREGVLPRVLGRTHPRYATPHVAISVNLVLTATIAAVIIGATDQATRDAVGASPGRLAAGFYLFAEGLTVGAPLVLFCYSALCVAGLRFALSDRAPRSRRARRIAVSLGALAAALAGATGSLYYCFAEVAPGAGVPGPYRAAPVLLVTAVAAATARALVQRRRGALAGAGVIFE